MTPIFQLGPNTGAITLEEIRDAFELSICIRNPEQKEAAALIFGINPDTLEKWWPTVDYLERSYKKTASRFIKPRAPQRRRQ